MTYEPAMQDGILYLDDGRENLDGSCRIKIDTDINMCCIEKRVDGIWQPASLEVGNNTLWVGKNIGIAGVGHHIATESVDGHLHLLAHTEFDGQLTTVDARILSAYSFTERLEFQADNTGTWTGTTQEFTIVSPAHILLNDGYLQTDSTAATALVRWRIWHGSDDTGDLIFDQSYPPADFPASSEIRLLAGGYLEFDNGETYFHRMTSDSNFSLKMDTTDTTPWLASDTSYLREDNFLQTKPWVSGDTWNTGDYFIDSRKLYITNASGVQTGTFASNASKWHNIGDESEDLWDKSGTALQNVSGVDTFIVHDDTRNRLEISGSAAQLICPDGTYKVGAVSGTAYLADASRNRVFMDTNETGLVSPDGNFSLKLSNSIADLQATWFNIGDGTRTRFDTKTDRIGLWSPDGNSNIILSNTGTVISGATSVCGGLGSNSFVIEPYSENYSGGSMVLKGTGMAEAPDSSNYIMDNFWGYLRIYTAAAQTKYIQIQNAGGATRDMFVGINVPSGNPTAQLDVCGTVYGSSGTSRVKILTNTSGYPYITIGGSSTTVAGVFGKSASGSILYFGEDSDTGGYVFRGGNFTTRFGTQDRLRVNTTDTELISPTEVFNFLLQDGFARIYDYTNSQIRFDCTTASTLISSPDGTNVVEVNNSNVKITNLPTSDPVDAGALWNDGGTLKVSAG